MSENEERNQNVVNLIVVGGWVSKNVIAVIFSVVEKIVLVSKTHFRVVFEFFINAYPSFEIPKTTVLLMKSVYNQTCQTGFKNGSNIFKM